MYGPCRKATNLSCYIANDGYEQIAQTYTNIAICMYVIYNKPKNRINIYDKN